MTKLTPILDAIQAEDGLKSATIEYLYGKIQESPPRRGHSGLIKKSAVVLATLLLTLLTGGFAYVLYVTPVAYVDMDVNPSIELALNRFHRVIDAQALNADGADILSGLSLTHKNYEAALVDLVEAMSERGYLQSDGLVSVTLQTDDNALEREMLAGIQAGLQDYIANRSAELDVFSVSGDIRTLSHGHGVSPAKYLAIQELIALDPTATIESCLGHSISEIKQMAHEHGDHHHDETADDGTASEDDAARETDSRHQHHCRHAS